MPTPLVIEELWAYISTGSEGEGVVAAPVPGLGNMPLVGADRDRMLSLAPQAQMIANIFGQKITLVKFSKRELVETIVPVEPEPGA